LSETSETSEIRLDSEIRNDGVLINAITGLGTAKDKSEYYAIRTPKLLSEQELEALYYDPLCRRVIDIYSEAAVTRQATIKLSEETNDYEGTLKSFENYLEDLDFFDYIEEALKLQRLYGGSALFLVLDDGLEPNQPVRPELIRGIADLVPLSRREITPNDYNYLNYRNPEYYRISTSKSVYKENDLQYLLVHSSRVLRFDGLFLPWRQRLINEGWGMSYLQPFYEVWKRYRGATDGMATMLNEMDLFVHKIPGLASKVTSGKESALRARLEANALARSLYGGMALDTEEEVSFASRSLSGAQDLFDRLLDDLVAAADMPKILLFGQSPAGGLSESGKYEDKSWAQSVERYQTHSLRRPLNQFFHLIFSIPQGPTRGQVPDVWSVYFPPYFSESDKDKAELRKQVADTDKIYVDMGVLTPAEIRQSRFSGTKYSMDVVLLEEEGQVLQLKRELEQESMVQGFVGQQAALEQQLNPEQASQEQQPPEQVNTDSADLIHMHGLTLMANASNGIYRMCVLTDELGHRSDAENVVLVGNRFNDRKIYRGHFVHEDGTMEAGPLLLGFYSSRSARRALQTYVPGRETGLTQIEESDIEHLKTSMVEYP
jgi:phage-related protein (TIGR01555 family)